MDQGDRIDTYYQESARTLAEKLVDAEDEIEVWKARVDRLEATACTNCGWNEE